MKSVFCDTPTHWLEELRQSGADRWDEMWEGVLHVPPSATVEHQSFGGSLLVWLTIHWAKPNGCRVYPTVNISDREQDWTHNDRIPDLTLLTPDRFHIDRSEFFFGAPLVVVEIRSPKDESYEKMPFYAKIGVPEVWVFDRDSKRPEIFRLEDDAYVACEPAANGWILSCATGIEFRHTKSGKLGIRIAARPESEANLPD